MPKRLSRTKSQQERAFRSGYNIGINAVFFGLHIQAMRIKKEKTVFDVALEIGVSERILENLEKFDYRTFIGLDLDTITKIARYYDVAAEIVFKSQSDFADEAPTIEPPKSFEEEVHG